MQYYREIGVIFAVGLKRSLAVCMDLTNHNGLGHSNNI